MGQIASGLMLLAFASQVAFAHAGSGSASISCGTDYVPLLNISYSPDVGDVGMSGLLWMGVLAPDQQSGAVMTERGWAGYEGGLYPFAARFDAGMPVGLPRTVSRSYVLPVNGYTTRGYVGYGVYLGHGAYAPEAQAKVKARRTLLDSVRAARVAAGKWNPDYDNDDRYIWALVQKNMTDQKKFASVLTIPLVDCTPVGASN